MQGFTHFLLVYAHVCLIYIVQAVEVAEVEVPEPGEGQVLVKIEMRPVNPADIFSVQGASVRSFPCSMSLPLCFRLPIVK